MKSKIPQSQEVSTMETPVKCTYSHCERSINCIHVTVSSTTILLRIH